MVCINFQQTRLYFQKRRPLITSKLPSYIATINTWEDIQPNSTRQNENANRKTSQRKPIWIPTGARHRRCDLCHKTNPRKTKERNIQVHMNFIDFKSAFDTIWRKALWKMMISFGIDEKIVRIIENLYKDTECAVVIDGNITQWFSVKVGVRQGCLLSPNLFNIFLDFVMDEIQSIPIDFHLHERLSCDIRYADDTTLKHGFHLALTSGNFLAVTFFLMETYLALDICER